MHNAMMCPWTSNVKAIASQKQDLDVSAFEFFFALVCLYMDKIFSIIISFTFLIGYPGQQRAKASELSKFGKPVCSSAN